MTGKKASKANRALTDGQSTAEILRKAYFLLSHYPSWCQGAQALSAQRKKVRNNSPAAVAWSIEGAVGKVSNESGIVPASIIYYLDQLAVEKGKETVARFNDLATHEAILEFLEEAIRRCDVR